MGTYQRFPSLDSKTLQAAVETIFPTAVSAGVEDFIMKSLWTADKEEIDTYKEGLQRINTIAWQNYGALFASLTIYERVKVLKEIEDTNFFDTLRSHTMQGMFADPIYGGNKDMIGWKLIGFPGAQFHPLTRLSRGWKASVFQSLKGKERLLDYGC